MSRVVDEEVGDGTTSVTVLASELIREAEKLIDMRIHPQTIISGWRQATKVAREALEKAAKNNGEDEDKFREDLLNIARTTLSSKILSQHKEFFSKLAVDAVLRLKGSGNLVANTPMDTDKIKVFGSRVRVENVAKVAELEV